MLALVHYPVLARDASLVTTSITNLDIHDIARSAHTYGVDGYYLVHPVAAQRELASRVVKHWTEGSGAVRIPDRRPPMESVRVVTSLDEAIQDVSTRCGQPAQVWVTSAQAMDDAIGHREAARQLREPGGPVLLVFGTGWGLAPAVIASADRRLLPIVSPRADAYNHLSVRAAAAILLDRLLAESSDK
jgi:hypothetical protein